MAWHSKMSKKTETLFTMENFVFLYFSIRKIRVFHSIWSHRADKKEHSSLLILMTLIERSIQIFSFGLGIFNNSCIFKLSICTFYWVLWGPLCMFLKKRDMGLVSALVITTGNTLLKFWEGLFYEEFRLWVYYK